MDYASAMAQSTRVTSKHRNYPALYDQVIQTLPPDPTVLEIGIANGGGLQTWRTIFGPRARIAGIDLNPRAVEMREEGFEVFIADTGEPSTWEALARSFPGTVDLLVDDGGHTNKQQIAALVHGIDLVRDGGWIVIEDVHASFMALFGNPSPFSAAHFLEQVQSDLHRRHPRSSVQPRRPKLAGRIGQVITATSWVGLRIAGPEPEAFDEVVAGQDASLMDYDHRFDSSALSGLAGRLPAAVAQPLRTNARRAASALQTRHYFGPGRHR